MPAKVTPKLVVHQPSPLNLQAILSTGCGAVVVTVMVVAPLPVMEAGLNEHFASAGRPAQAKLTALVKPGSLRRAGIRRWWRR
jgi:hypothetical protein